MGFEFHPIADLFPLMTGAEFDALVADIAEYGQREPIWLHPDGRILDGRNRYNACTKLGIKPRMQYWEDDGDPLAFVVSENIRRRHLDESQRAMIAARIANMQSGRRTDLQPTANLQEVSRSQAAQLLNVSERTVNSAAKVLREAPDIVPDIEAGRQTVTAAEREIKERKREARREENRAIIETVPAATDFVGTVRFATIVLDPPWDWGDEGDVDQFGRARPVYNTISIDALANLPIGELADVDCHLYLWITNRSLPKGFDLLRAWGFRYITCLTWVKPSFGMGNYFRGQTEHVLFGVRGSQALKRHDAATVFYADRGPQGHSSKPPAFLELVESCSPGPYLEMFARSNRAGWITWGEHGFNGI